ncbi:MAG: GTPase HflX [Alphaproteobacteria bacterium]
MKKKLTSHALVFDKAYVLHVQLKADQLRVDNRRAPSDCLEEAVSLAQAACLEVVEAQICVLARVHPKALVGKGWCEQIKAAVVLHEAQVLVVNYALSPVQQRNLEKILGCKVVDRTGLILEIFGQRAKTAEGVLQVELATLQYRKSRLVRSWSHLERQRGGFGFLGGPGESQLELDKRMIGERIKRLQGDLERVKQMRSLQRKSRKKSDYPLVALVGYTNAGKSTLFNKLTGWQTFTADLLFATLDPTVRQVILPSGRKVILSDTVGFISDLPTQLVSAFRATLEEVIEADLLIHVRDISHPETAAQQQDVLEVLKTLHLEHRMEKHLMECHNKSDLLPPELKETVQAQNTRKELAPSISSHYLISAQTGEGIPEMLEGIDLFFKNQGPPLTLLFSTTEGQLLAWLYAHGHVVQRIDEDERIQVSAHLEASTLELLKRQFPQCEILP